ncbi:MAG: ABC transporter ATP-binding protein [Bacteroidia bacterium]|nr:ABC transporter ATP-binding protein [Bacteroidia bacterium]
MDKVFQCDKLVVGYKSEIILGPVSFDIEANTLTTLIGINGSGKSTLLKSLGGFIDVLGGEVLFHGKPVRKYSLRDLSSMRCMLSPSFEGYVNYKVRDLLSLSRYPFTNWMGVLSERDHEMVSRSLHITGMDKLGNRMVYELSDGEKQKLSIARAYCQGTPVIFFDEPFVHLDLKQKSIIYDLLIKLVLEERKTVIVATHDMEFVSKYATEVLSVLSNGSIEKRRSSEITKEELERIFELN